MRNGAEAVDLAERAERLTNGREPAVLDILAAAYAEAGRFTEATEVAERAVSISMGRGNLKLANALLMRIKLYRAKSPYHEQRNQAYEKKGKDI